MITTQAGFGYQQELVPGMRPGDGPMPMVQQGQERQRPGGRRGAQLFVDLQFPNGQLIYVSGECISTSAYLTFCGGLLHAQGQYSGEMTFSYSRKLHKMKVKEEEEVAEIANLFNSGKKKKKHYIAS